jgi:hypothetical protein
MDIDLDTTNFKSTIKFRVNCGWDSNLLPSNVYSTINYKNIRLIQKIFD